MGEKCNLCGGTGREVWTHYPDDPDRDQGHGKAVSNNWRCMRCDGSGFVSNEKEVPPHHGELCSKAFYVGLGKDAFCVRRQNHLGYCEDHNRYRGR